MALNIGGREHPTHWVNPEGLKLRLQVFLIVRDAEGRVACVREKERPQVWNLPGETVPPNVDLNETAGKVSELWFVDRLPASVADVQTYPADRDDPNDKWYVLFIYEAEAPDPSADDGGLKMPDDTAEIRFFPLDEPPEAWGMDHGSVFERLKRLDG